MTVSDVYEDKINDALYNNTSLLVAVPWLALHDDDPGEAGGNEVTGGSYARVDVSGLMGASSGGAVSNTGVIEFADMPAVDVVAVSAWDDETAGDVIESGWLTGSPVVRGVFSCEASDDTFTAKGHGLATNDRVVFSAEGLGVTLPTGITAGVLYHVIASGLGTDTFKVSATSGGATVAITVDGNGSFLKVVPKSLGAGDTLRFQTGALSFVKF